MPLLKPFETLIASNALKFGIDPDIISAIILTESGGNTWAVRYEPMYKWVLGVTAIREYSEAIGITVETIMISQKMSFGLMQIMYAIALDEYDFRGSPTMLCEPSVGIDYGCRHLRKFIDRYGASNESDYISAYNQGSARKTEGGMYWNQKYVDKVYKHLREIRSQSVV